MTQVKVEDQGLASVIDLRPMLIPHSGGRHEHQKFSKTKVNVVERLVNQLMHFGKKHAKNTGRMGGKKQKAMSIVRTAFEIIHLKTGQNPVQFLVKAIENSSPNEDTTRMSYGGVVYHISVDISPDAEDGPRPEVISEGVREATFGTEALGGGGARGRDNRARPAATRTASPSSGRTSKKESRWPQGRPRPSSSVL